MHISSYHIGDGSRDALASRVDDLGTIRPAVIRVIEAAAIERAAIDPTGATRLLVLASELRLGLGAPGGGR